MKDLTQVIESDEFDQAVLVQMRPAQKYNGMKLNDSELRDFDPVCGSEGEIASSG